MTAGREVHYADIGGLQIAYEVMGDGPIDIVIAGEHGSHIDLFHEHPRMDRFLRRFSEYGRLIHLDVRGAGLSDRMDGVPPLEVWVDDVRAVLAAVDSTSAALVGQGQGGQLFMLFAAMYPNQTRALVTVNGYARLRWAPDYPWGHRPDHEARMLASMGSKWGTGETLGSFNAVGAADPRQGDWMARLERSTATPGQAVHRQRIAFELDVRDILSTIVAPTLVVQSADDRYVPKGHAQYLVDHIAGAKYLELAGFDHTPSASDDNDLLMDAIEEFLTGTTRRPVTDRALRTVVFTDIVGSTELASVMGDRRWRSLLEEHESVSRREIEAARGRVVKFTGDGVMATFEGPARAVQCLRLIADELGRIGLPLRAGVHTGEVELIGDDIGGIAVHIAARISALAGAGEVFTSSTVRDLTAGSGLVFEDRGEQQLKGVADPWRIFEVAR